MLSLCSNGSDMSLTCRCFLLRVGTRNDSAIATVEADAVVSAVVNPFIVDIVNARSVYAAFRTVIKEVSVIPAATSVPLAIVTVTVVDPAIETNLGAPVAFVEAIAPVSPTPIARCPQEAFFRSHHPFAVHPVVVGDAFVIRP